MRDNQKQVSDRYLWLRYGFVPALLVYVLVAGIIPVRAAEVVDFVSARKVRKGDAATVQEDTGPAGHPLDIDFELLASGVISTGMLLRVEPEPSLFFTGRVSRVGVDINGTFSLMAPLEGREYAYFTLSVSDDIALGEVRLPDEQQRYAIRFDAIAAQHVAQDVHDRELDYIESGPAIIPPASIKRGSDVTIQSEPQIVGDPNAPAVIDVMIVYTPAAASWASSNEGGINNTINQAMTRAQMAADNSGIGVTFRLVHSAQISYTESGNSSTDLGRLRHASDGYMDAVHSWRTTYGADLVALFSRVEDTGGLGYALVGAHLPGGIPDYAFSLTRVQQASWTYTHVHEMGHNMGAGHHKGQNFQAGPKAFSYSAGWRWVGGDDGRYCSIMAYEQGSYYADGQTHTRVANFSNPSISHQGQASGHSADGDNARTIRETKHVIAAYRATVGKKIGFRAIALDDRVMLRWEDPQTHGFGSSTVHIRFSTTAYPTHTGEGTQVYQGSAQYFLHEAGIVSGSPHYYTIWVSDDGSTFIEP